MANHWIRRFNRKGEMERIELSELFGRDVSERVLRFHRDFIDLPDDNYLDIGHNLGPSLGQFYTHNPFFTDHGRSHTYRIIDNIARMEEKSDFELNAGEKYLLACTAWVHDIGMSVNTKIQYIPDEPSEIPDWFQDIGTTKDETLTIDNNEYIRKHHHILSRYFINNHHNHIGLENFEVANLVGELSAYHRRKTDITELDNKTTISIGREEVKVALRSLEAIFRIADACDTDAERADEISSKFVQKLPPESQGHWEACQLITSVEINPQTALINLNGKYESEDQLEKLRNKTLDIYEEIDCIATILLSEPHKLNIGDVVCTAKQSNPPYTETNIIGSELDKKKNNGKFEIKETIWKLDIKNSSGGAIITKDMVLSANRPVKRRFHKVRSDDNPMMWDWESDIRAWDGNGTELKVIMQMDHGTKKEFDIEFDNELKPGEDYKYTYEYEWDNLFPYDEEYFESVGLAKEVRFEINFPAEITPERVWCEEIDRGVRNKVDGVEVEQVDDYHYVCEVSKSRPECDLRLCWMVA